MRDAQNSRWAECDPEALATGTDWPAIAGMGSDGLWAFLQHVCGGCGASRLGLAGLPPKLRPTLPRRHPSPIQRGVLEILPIVLGPT